MLPSLRQAIQVLALVAKQLTGRVAVGMLLAAVVLGLWRPSLLEPGIGYAGGEAICGGGLPPSQFLSAQGSSVAGLLSQTNPATGASTSIGPVVTTGGLPLSITGLAQQLSTSTATPGTLFGATGRGSPNNPSSLVTINPATAQATVVGQFHTAAGAVHSMADLPLRRRARRVRAPCWA